MSGQAAYMVVRKDSLDRSQVVAGFMNERDADNYIDDLRKKDDRYGLAMMRYEYFITQVLIHPSSVKVV